jgi:hypothetical protein
MRGRRHLSPRVRPKCSPATQGQVASVFEHQDRAGEELLPTYTAQRLHGVCKRTCLFLSFFSHWAGGAGKNDPAPWFECFSSASPRRECDLPAVNPHPADLGSILKRFKPCKHLTVHFNHVASPQARVSAESL